MEPTIGVILGLHWDNGKYNENYYLGIGLRLAVHGSKDRDGYLL